MLHVLTAIELGLAVGATAAFEPLRGVAAAIDAAAEFGEKVAKLTKRRVRHFDARHHDGAALLIEEDGLVVDAVCLQDHLSFLREFRNGHLLEVAEPHGLLDLVGKVARAHLGHTFSVALAAFGAQDIPDEVGEIVFAIAARRRRPSRL